MKVKSQYNINRAEGRKEGPAVRAYSILIIEQSADTCLAGLFLSERPVTPTRFFI